MNKSISTFKLQFGTGSPQIIQQIPRARRDKASPWQYQRWQRIADALVVLHETDALADCQILAAREKLQKRIKEAIS